MSGLTPYRDEAPEVAADPLVVPIPRQWIGAPLRWLWGYASVRRWLGGRWECERIGHAVVGFWRKWHRVTQWTPDRVPVQLSAEDRLLLRCELYLVEVKVHTRAGLMISRAFDRGPELEAEIAALTRDIDHWNDGLDGRLYQSSNIIEREEWL